MIREVCKSAGLGNETMEVAVRGKTITDIRNMPVVEGVKFFADEPSIG